MKSPRGTSLESIVSLGVENMGTRNLWMNLLTEVAQTHMYCILSTGETGLLKVGVNMPRRSTDAFGIYIPVPLKNGVLEFQLKCFHIFSEVVAIFSAAFQKALTFPIN
jgi:hypothetical protein